MAVPTQLSDLSATAASNSPAGGDTVGTTMDDYIRAIQSIIVRISAGTDAMATPNIGAATGTSLVLSGLATVNGAFTSLGLDDNATAKALTLSGSGANSVTIANSATNPTIGTSAGSLAISCPVVVSPGTGNTFQILDGFLDVAGRAQVLSSIALPAGGGTGVVISATTSNIGIYFGSGAPTVSAAKGSLYLRSDGTTTNNRMYVNTDGGTTWTAVTTAA